MTAKRGCVIAGALLATSLIAFSQDSLFVYREVNGLVLGGRPFYAIGVNSYFLENLVSYGDTTHVGEILRTAKRLGITTVRTWGFFDADDSTDPAVIQFLPGRYNESGLRALDYVVARAKEHSIRLIIPLVNNWDDYGGMNQYVRWLARITTPERMFQGEEKSAVQKVVGAANRSYAVQISSTLAHDDFYTNPLLKQWYKDYVGMVLNRLNTLTGITYKDEPAVLMWELANEPRSSDRSGSLVSAWVNEMSTFIKSIDSNHLVGTGEEGHDVSTDSYTEVSSYSNQSWLFDGTAGSSFTLNTSLPNIDAASIHCYPEDWGFQPSAAVAWLRDHSRIALRQGKPLVVGEAGIRQQTNVFFDGFFNAAFAENVSGVLPWQFAYEGRVEPDGFAFSCPDDSNMCDVLTRYAELYRRRREGMLVPPAAATLYQNYPNPFNYLTVISFDLPTPGNVQLHVYNLLGQRVKTLFDEYSQVGRRAVLFDAVGIASGVYLVRLTTGAGSMEGKLVLIK